MVEEEKKQPAAATAPVGGGEEIPVRLRGRFVPDETLLSTEIRRKLWDGQIALKIDLAVDDCISIERPRSLYVSLVLFARSNHFCSDHGPQGELLVLHPARREVTFRSVCAARLDR